MTPQVRDPCIVHPLPPAPDFVGRDGLLAELSERWRAGQSGVVALVGLGGAGKTAVAARFLHQILAAKCLPRPASVFVWSFYQEPDANLFLEQLHAFFIPSGMRTVGKGTGLLHLLRDALSVDGPHLLLLEGLERVQRPGDDSGSYGQIEDPLLRGLLSRLAEGIGNTIAFVTSRFHLTDLQAQEGVGYWQLAVDDLEPAAAVALLRQRGVKGDDATQHKLVDSYGAHALTLDHLGGLIGRFCNGDPTLAPELDSLAVTSEDRQAFRLARLLHAYEEHLPPTELTMLCRLCLLRRSVGVEQLNQLFLCTPSVHARTIRELSDGIRNVPGLRDRLGDGLADDLASAVHQTLQEAVCEAPLPILADALQEAGCHDFAILAHCRQPG